MERIVGSRIPFSLKIYLLCDFSDLELNRPRKMLLLNLSLAATLLLAAKWKTADIPTKKDWLRKATFLSLMCKLSAIIKYLQGHTQPFVRLKRQWAVFYQYYETDFALASQLLELL